MCFVKSGKWGEFFCKKVDFSSTQGALSTVSVFFILHFTYLGGGHPAPPAYGPVSGGGSSQCSRLWNKANLQRSTFDRRETGPHRASTSVCVRYTARCTSRRIARVLLRQPVLVPVHLFTCFLNFCSVTTIQFMRCVSNVYLRPHYSEAFNLQTVPKAT